MNGASRQVKNPLLSAAGPGFPIENYTENALLVPVAPATPAVLRDDVEQDNLVGQKQPINVQSETSASTHENFPTKAFSQPKEGKETANQTTKQGYFTTILSSLPTLSLSSKTDSSGSQISQTSENIGGVIHEPKPYVPSGSYGSQSEIPGLVTSNPQDSRSIKLPEFTSLASTSTLTTSSQAAIPPSLPQASDAPVSYRLGNQRRLKYAPPPDLTSNNAKSPTLATAKLLLAKNVFTPSSILNPLVAEGSVQSSSSNVQHISTLSEQPVLSEQLSQNSSLHSSFRSSPVTVGTPRNSTATPVNPNLFYENSSAPPSSQFTTSSSRPIPSRILEPATPQNTPANVPFSCLGTYINQDFQPTSNLVKEVTVFKDPNQLNPLPEFSKGSIFERSLETTRVPSLIPEETDATFTPISAAKVTEKLEHLLAEQEEAFSCHATIEASSEIDEITSNVAAELAKSFESQSNILQSANKSFDEPHETELCNIQASVDHSKSNILNDVFLEPEPAPQSPIFPEIYTADSDPIVTDSQAKLNAYPSQQYYQAQSTSMPSFTFYTNKHTDDKWNLDYVTPTQILQENIFNSPKQSASSYFDSLTKNTDQFQSFSSHNANASLDQSVINASNNLQPIKKSTTCFPPAIDSTDCASHWRSDHFLQPITPSKQAHTESSLSATPGFYNPTEFANESVKQLNLSDAFDQHSTVTQNPPFYENISGFQQTYSNSECNIYPIACSITAVPESTGSATLSPVQMSLNSVTNRSTSETIPASFQNWASGSSDKRMQYRAVYQHWFYRKEVENKTLWLPFSMQDSLKLEEVHNSSDIAPETTVATDGGRYDVDILHRQRAPVYWAGASNEVRRCSWFYKGATESRYVPYDESTAVKLEEEYKQACLTNNWNRKIELNNGEYVAFHSATVQVHYLLSTSTESTGSWTNSAGSEDSAYLQGTASRPRVVKRGVDEFNIDEGEPEKADHLLFLVHGIGSVCDLKFRTVEEVVDEFRSISLQLVQSHYRTACEQGVVNRIEVLPISWHTTLHSGDTGIDKKLQAITLESIPKLRHFTNDTLLDILFYTSPVYCQTIMQTVGSEMNRLHALFKERNPSFDGGIFLGGHSLGSLIMFDLLCHQKPVVEETENNKDSDDEKGGENDSVGPIKPMPAPILRRRLSKRISYVMGAAGTGQPYIHYPQLNFQPCAFFALGSPIGMFVTVRGIDTLGEDFALPTCPAFFNIFHPFDPVAYRMESLITPEACKFRPMLIPHHKGRKRMHLELKETMARVGADLKQKLIDSVKSTWNSVYQLALFHKPDNQALEREIDKVVEEQLQNPPSVPDQQNSDDGGADLKIGKLNSGRRIDYVLQEAPFEYINEYIFALTSHICYWESEDTMLLILKEIYGSIGIQTDAQLPQQTMSVERVSSSSSSLNLAGIASPSKSCAGTPSPVMGVDPTLPISGKPVGPPPKAGFVRKS